MNKRNRFMSACLSVALLISTLPTFDITALAEEPSSAGDDLPVSPNGLTYTATGDTHVHARPEGIAQIEWNGNADLASREYDTWDGTLNSFDWFLQHKGTEDDPYLISSAEDIMTLRRMLYTVSPYDPGYKIAETYYYHSGTKVTKDDYFKLKSATTLYAWDKSIDGDKLPNNSISSQYTQFTSHGLYDLGVPLSLNIRQSELSEEAGLIIGSQVTTYRYYTELLADFKLGNYTFKSCDIVEYMHSLGKLDYVTPVTNRAYMSRADYENAHEPKVSSNPSGYPFTADYFFTARADYVNGVIIVTSKFDESEEYIVPISDVGLNLDVTLGSVTMTTDELFENYNIYKSRFLSSTTTSDTHPVYYDDNKLFDPDTVLSANDYIFSGDNPYTPAAIGTPIDDYSSSTTFTIAYRTLYDSRTKQIFNKDYLTNPTYTAYTQSSGSYYYYYHNWVDDSYTTPASNRTVNSSTPWEYVWFVDKDVTDFDSDWRYYWAAKGDILALMPTIKYTFDYTFKFHDDKYFVVIDWLQTDIDGNILDSGTYDEYDISSQLGSVYRYMGASKIDSYYSRNYYKVSPWVLHEADGTDNIYIPIKFRKTIGSGSGDDNTFIIKAPVSLEMPSIELADYIDRVELTDYNGDTHAYTDIKDDIQFYKTTKNLYPITHRNVVYYNLLNTHATEFFNNVSDTRVDYYSDAELSEHGGVFEDWETESVVTNKYFKLVADIELSEAPSDNTTLVGLPDYYHTLADCSKWKNVDFDLNGHVLVFSGSHDALGAATIHDGTLISKGGYVGPVVNGSILNNCDIYTWTAVTNTGFRGATEVGGTRVIGQGADSSVRNCNFYGDYIWLPFCEMLDCNFYVLCLDHTEDFMGTGIDSGYGTPSTGFKNCNFYFESEDFLYGNFTLSGSYLDGVTINKCRIRNTINLPPKISNSTLMGWSPNGYYLASASPTATGSNNLFHVEGPLPKTSMLSFNLSNLTDSTFEWVVTEATQSEDMYIRAFTGQSGKDNGLTSCTISLTAASDAVRQALRTTTGWGSIIEYGHYNDCIIECDIPIVGAITGVYTRGILGQGNKGRVEIKGTYLHATEAINIPLCYYDGFGPDFAINSVFDVESFYVSPEIEKSRRHALSPLGACKLDSCAVYIGNIHGEYCDINPNLVNSKVELNFGGGEVTYNIEEYGYYIGGPGGLSTGSTVYVTFDEDSGGKIGRLIGTLAWDSCLIYIAPMPETYTFVCPHLIAQSKAPMSGFTHNTFIAPLLNWDPLFDCVANLISTVYMDMTIYPYNPESPPTGNYFMVDSTHYTYGNSGNGYHYGSNLPVSYCNISTNINAGDHLKGASAIMQNSSASISYISAELNVFNEQEPADIPTSLFHCSYDGNPTANGWLFRSNTVNGDSGLYRSSYASSGANSGMLRNCYLDLPNAQDADTSKNIYAYPGFMAGGTELTYHNGRICNFERSYSSYGYQNASKVLTSVLNGDLQLAACYLPEGQSAIAVYADKDYSTRDDQRVGNAYCGEFYTLSTIDSVLQGYINKYFAAYEDEIRSGDENDYYKAYTDLEHWRYYMLYRTALEQAIYNGYATHLEDYYEYVQYSSKLVDAGYSTDIDFIVPKLESFSAKYISASADFTGELAYKLDKGHTDTRTYLFTNYDEDAYVVNQFTGEKLCDLPDYTVVMLDAPYIENNITSYVFKTTVMPAQNGHVTIKGIGSTTTSDGSLYTKQTAGVIEDIVSDGDEYVLAYATHKLGPKMPAKIPSTADIVSTNASLRSPRLRSTGNESYTIMGYTQQGVDTVITPVFEIKRNITIDITNSEHGTIRVPFTVAVEGDEVTISYNVEPGYTITNLCVDGTPLTSLKFFMPGKDITITGECVPFDGGIERFNLMGQDGVIDQIAHTIDVTVPRSNYLSNALPYITFYGDYVDPSIDERIDFTDAEANPIVYTVHYGDNQENAYTVTVHQSMLTQSLYDFVLCGVHGDIDNSNKTVRVKVPYGTDVTALAPDNIAYSADAITPDESAIKDFSIPQTYTLTTAGLNAVSYTVYVTELDPDDREITEFKVSGIEGAIDDTNNTIILTVPRAMDLTNIRPDLLTYLGDTLEPSKVDEVDLTNDAQYTVTSLSGLKRTYSIQLNPLSDDEKHIDTFVLAGREAEIDQVNNVIRLTIPRNVNITNITPDSMTYTGKAYYPQDDVAQDFTLPVEYTVIAADNSERTYTVEVTQVSSEALLLEFAIQGYDGVIDQDAKTVTVTVPYSLNVVDVPPSHVKISDYATLSPAADLAQNFSNPFIYSVTSEDGLTTNDYTVTVVKEAPTADAYIERFAIDTYEGTINQATGEILVTLPSTYTPADIASKIPSITWHGKTLVPDENSAQDFNVPVTYTVTAEDPEVFKDYVVTVVIEDPEYNITIVDSTGGTITASAAKAKAGETVYVGIQVDTEYELVSAMVDSMPYATDDTNSYSFTMPSKDVTLTASYKNMMYNVTVSVHGDGDVELTNTRMRTGDILTILPVPGTGSVLTKLEIDGDVYNALPNVEMAMPEHDVHIEAWFEENTPAPLDKTAIITQFSLYDVEGVIDQEAGTILVELPSTYTSDDITNKVPDITWRGETIVPLDTDAQDFTNIVTYTVTAEDPTVTKSYDVTVIIKPKASTAIITEFSIDEYSGVINQEAGTILVELPKTYSQDDIKNKVPSITWEGDTLVPNDNEAQDFTGIVTYTVTAEDPTIYKTYDVTVTIKEKDKTAIITEFKIDNYTGVIDQDAGTINVVLPSTYVPADIKDKVPSIVWQGETLDPNEHIGQDFTEPIHYVVTAEDPAVTKDYLVTVTILEPDQYAIYVEYNEGGTVEASALYATAGTYITVEAIPDAIHKVVSVKLDTEELTAPYGFSMPAHDVTVYGRFDVKKYNITVLNSEGGTITPSATEATPGDSILLDVRPDTEWAIDHVTLDNINLEYPYIFEMPDNDVVIEGFFTQNFYNITVVDNEHGTVEPSAYKAPMGKTIYVSPRADDEWILNWVKVDDDLVYNNQFTMPNHDVVLTSNFTVKEYTITVEEVKHGDITASIYRAPYGTPIDVRATTDEGYKLKDLIVDRQRLGEVYSYSFTMPKKDITISADVRQIEYNIYIEQATGGTINCSVTVAPPGKQIPLRVTTNRGYKLVGITLNGEVKSDKTYYTFTMPNADVIVSAIFEQTPITVSQVPVYTTTTGTQVEYIYNTTSTADTTRPPEPITTTRGPEPESWDVPTYQTYTPKETTAPPEVEDDDWEPGTYDLILIMHEAPSTSPQVWITDVPVNTHIIETTNHTTKEPYNPPPVTIEDDDINVPTGQSLNFVPLLLSLAGIGIGAYAKIKIKRRK